MKVSKPKAPDKVDIPMTPMIDVVFQLLVFFIMSFKVVAPEGDFNIRMPLSAPSQGAPDPDVLPPIKVALKADGGGNLVSGGIRVGDRSVSGFSGLRSEILSLIGGAGGSRGDYEVEFECDYDLKYDYVIKAITAVTGQRVDGQIQQLIEKVKFAPPKKPS